MTDPVSKTIKLPIDEIHDVWYLATVGLDTLKTSAESLEHRKHKEAAIEVNTTMTHALANFIREVTSGTVFPLSH